MAVVNPRAYRPPAAVRARFATSIAAARLRVLEIDRDGLAHPHAPGELIRLSSTIGRTVLASSGLVDPTGVAVAPDGSNYISNYGTSTGKRLTGEVVRLR